MGVPIFYKKTDQRNLFVNRCLLIILKKIAKKQLEKLGIKREISIFAVP